jgi:hypothetical protein
MNESDGSTNDHGDQLRLTCYDAANVLAKLCYDYRDGNPWPETNALDDVVNFSDDGVVGLDLLADRDQTGV